MAPQARARDSKAAQNAGSPILGVGDGSAPTYRRHEPEKTSLYKVVSEHLETFLEEVRNHYEKPLPSYVVKELRDFLDCGLLVRGFLKAVCTACGRTLLVPFSCKKRGLCCSCGARRMCNGAAHLVDHVLPDVPVRQFVLSVPFELRLLLACRADAFGAVTRIFIQEVFRWQRERARETGLTNVRFGALSMQHRFGSSLNGNAHVHAVIPNGVFSRPDPGGPVEFYDLRAPAADDLEEIAFNVHQRFRRWLGRHGLLKSETDDDFSNESPELSALDACAQGSLGLGDLVTLKVKPAEGTDQEADEDGFERRGANPRVGECHGYSLYAGNTIPAGSPQARERLLRYCLRPPLSLERLSINRDGNIVYQVKATRRGKATQRIMKPMQFMARIVALIPPPRHPLLRFFGVFAPHSSWRSSVVPEDAKATQQDAEHEHALAQPSGAPVSQTSPTGPASNSPTNPEAAAPLLAPAAKESNEPIGNKNVGPRYSAPWRIDWHTLLKRVHGVDSLACPCGGRLQFVALVTEPETARSILESMGLPADPPPVAKARSPAFDPDPPPPDWD